MLSLYKGLGQILLSPKYNILGGMTYQQKVEKAFQSRQRTNQEAKMIFEEVCNNKFFKSFLGSSTKEINHEGILYCCQKMEYQKIPAGEVVFGEGDESNGKMYLVYTGELLVVSRKMQLIPKDSIKATPAKLSKLGSQEDVNFTNLVENYQETIVSQKIDDNSENDGSSTHHRNLTKKTIVDHIKQGHMRTPSKSRRRGSILGGGGEPTPKVQQKKSQFVKHSEPQAEEESPGVRVAKDYGTIVDKIEKEGFFGERAILGGLVKRGATIITNTDCELFSVDKDEFLIMKRDFDKVRTEYLTFLFDFMPGYDKIVSKETREMYLSLLTEQTFDFGEYIVNEEDPSNFIYMLLEGKCHITRRVYMDYTSTEDHKLFDFRKLFSLIPAKVEQICVCEIGKGSFIGDEILLSNSGKPAYSSQSDE